MSEAACECPNAQQTKPAAVVQAQVRGDVQVDTVQAAAFDIANRAVGVELAGGAETQAQGAFAARRHAELVLLTGSEGGQVHAKAGPAQVHIMQAQRAGVTQAGRGVALATGKGKHGDQ